MRLLTEATGQVLTRNVAADRCWALARDQQASSLADVEEESQIGADADGDPQPKISPESAWFRSRRTWLTSTS